MSITTYELNHLDQLEAEAIHIFREVASEFERPCLMFSGGKDSILMLHLATKAFWPARLPFPVLHVDTGHNFPEVIEYRDQRIKELEARLVVASVQKYIEQEEKEITSVYFAHKREVFQRDGMLLADSDFVTRSEDEKLLTRKVRYRTVGDMSCTGAVESEAENLKQIIEEISSTRITERGATRADDRVSEAAMEDRKKEGYF